MSKFSSYKQMQKLFEGFRNSTINEELSVKQQAQLIKKMKARGDSDQKIKKFINMMDSDDTPTPPGLDDFGTAVDKDGNSAKDLSGNPPSDLGDMRTHVDQDGSSAPPDDLGDMGTHVDKDGSSADMIQKKAQAFDQVEGALKQLLKKIQDAGL